MICKCLKWHRSVTLQLKLKAVQPTTKH